MVVGSFPSPAPLFGEISPFLTLCLLCYFPLDWIPIPVLSRFNNTLSGLPFHFNPKAATLSEGHYKK